ncbi:hypothetical protein VPH35_050983 [Triticum aestivum]
MEYFCYTFLLVQMILIGLSVSFLHKEPYASDFLLLDLNWLVCAVLKIHMPQRSERITNFCVYNFLILKNVSNFYSLDCELWQQLYCMFRRVMVFLPLLSYFSL